MTPHLFKLPDTSGLSLRDQICEVVSAAITSRTLPHDRPLPSCRELAGQLNVSRNTVFAAYHRLIELGFLIARDRSGYFVNPDLRMSLSPSDGEDKPARRGHALPAPIEFEPSTLIPIENPLDWVRYPYPFIYNQFDPDLFPVDAWRECSRQALSRRQIPVWVGDSVESDSPRLVQQLRQRVLSYRGIYADDDEILVTLGAQNALCIISMVLANRNRPIAIEDPGFHGARNAFRLAGHKVVGVPVDRDGLIPSAIPAGSQLVFATPSHQFPTMVTMSLARRRALIEAAIENDFLVLEDDYEAEINYFTRPSPSLRSLDANGRIVYVGSLSKTISPGIRLGFIVAHRNIIREARMIRGVMLRHPPTIVQETAARFIRLGYYDAHLRHVERRYRKRWHTMRDAIRRHLSMLDMTDTVGGSCFWLTGPAGFDATELAARLTSEGVLVDKGQTFYLNNENRRSFRVGFAYVPVGKLEEGVKIIAREVRKLLSPPRGQ
ncbi:MAG: PLP-dependent aminotransferase family protein [Thiotrichales bacterium]|nr:PLP-dependent aminotransferase family protein [Thiotrichales bacterium]